MKLRLISRLIVLILVLLVGTAIILKRELGSGVSSPVLQGALQQERPAPGFTLVDQNGATISLAELRGRPVVLTFWDTRCSADCEESVSTMYAVVSRLGGAASQVTWIAVSVDSAHDTQANVTAFLTNHGLNGNVHYLTGTSSELIAVWSAYHVGNSTGNLQQGQVYVIDASGMLRAYMPAGFTADSVISDVRALL